MPKRTVISTVALAVAANPQIQISAGNAYKESTLVQNNDQSIVITVVTDKTQQTGGITIQPGSERLFSLSAPLFAYSATGTPNADIQDTFLQ